MSKKFKTIIVPKRLKKDHIDPFDLSCFFCNPNDYKDKDDDVKAYCNKHKFKIYDYNGNSLEIGGQNKL